MSRKKLFYSCVKTLLVVFISFITQSCSNDDGVINSDFISMVMVSGTHESLSPLSQEETKRVDSIMTTDEFRMYVESVQRLKSKVNPYCKSLGEEKIAEFKKNMRDTIYTKTFFKEMNSKIDVRKEREDMNKAMSRLISITREMNLSTLEKISLFLKSANV